MFSDEKINNTTVRSEIINNLTLAGPIAVAQIVQMGIHIADQIMVGRLGSVNLAAIALGSYIIALAQIFGIGLLSAVSALGAQAHGAEEDEKFRHVVRAGVVVALLLSIPNMLVVALVPMILPAFGLFLGTYIGGDPNGYDPEMLGLITDYVYVSFFCLPAFLLFTALRNFITVLGITIPITVISIVSLGIAILTNYAFIYGNFGAPKLGITGAAISVVTLNWFQFLALLFYISRRHRLAHFQPFKHLNKVGYTFLRDIFVVGLPAAFSILFESGLFIASSFLIAIFGEAQAAGYGATLSICTLSFMVPWAIGQAATVRVGRAIGARKPDDAKTAGITAMGLGVIFMTLSGGAMVLFGHQVMGIFLDTRLAANEAAIMAGLALIPIAAIFQIADGLQVTAICALRGAKDTKVPMVITGISYWVIGISCALALGYWFALESRGVFWGLAIGLMAAAVILTIRFWRLPAHYWQHT